MDDVDIGLVPVPMGGQLQPINKGVLDAAGPDAEALRIEMAPTPHVFDGGVDSGRLG